MSREYYLHKRQNGIFYVQFVNPESGKPMSARSTGETKPLDAEVQAKLWLANGLPTGKQVYTPTISKWLYKHNQSSSKLKEYTLKRHNGIKR